MDLSKNTVVQLKAILRSIGQPVSGLKRVLIERIEEYRDDLDFELLGHEEPKKATKSKKASKKDEIGGYIKMYKTGGPDYFFWSKEAAEDYVDSRNRKVRAIIAVPKKNVKILKTAKRDVAYYTYEGYHGQERTFSDQTNVFGVVSSKAKAKEFERGNGRTLGGSVDGKSSFMMGLKIIS